LQAGNREEGLQALRRVLELAPNHPGANQILRQVGGF